jgi:hypothetical protein
VWLFPKHEGVTVVYSGVEMFPVELQVHIRVFSASVATRDLIMTSSERINIFHTVDIFSVVANKSM